MTEASKLSHIAKDPQPARERVAFTGLVSDYYGIWLVNILLSILTIGIYSAWAKVRTQRFFLNNTSVFGSNFNYHATGMMLLKGRLIVIAMIILAVLMQTIFPGIAVVIALAFIAFYPWALHRSIAFNGRMTSWRNVRFSWHGQLGNAYLHFLIYPVLAVLTSLITLPMFTRSMQEYLVNHCSLGKRKFFAKTKTSSYYKAAFMALGFIFLSFVLILLLLMLFVAISAIHTILDHENAAGYSVGVWMFAIISIILSIFIGTNFYFTFTRNIIINATTLDGQAQFHAKINGWQLSWIYLSNIVLLIATLGLAYPYTRLRLWRYFCHVISVEPLGDIEAFVDANQDPGSAFGSEFADLQNIDVPF